MTTHGGHCLCGEIAYEFDGDPLMSGVCHCKNCQRQAGTAFSVLAGVASANFRLTKGELKVYEDTGDSGNKVLRKFCGNCGSPIVSALSGQADTVYIKAGTLDDTSILNPAFHIWCDSAQHWVTIPEGVARMARQQ